jgi:aryl-alcohol dehydrogenase-like predicted oxidoreductase
LTLTILLPLFWTVIFLLPRYILAADQLNPKEKNQMKQILTRQLGKSGLQVSAMGLGCWAIGGSFYLNGKPDGWGEVDDAESVRAIHRALDLGVNFFDTADVYGTGHSERILAQALQGYRDKVVIATKFGFTYDEEERQITGMDVSPTYIRRACEASLRRLQTDTIDLYQLHCGASPVEAEAIIEALEQLQAEGLIRAYAWSTDDPQLARLFAEAPHCTAVQHDLNVLREAQEMIDLCETYNLASINRSPLASGLLSGKYQADSILPADDFRAAGHEWAIYFENGRPQPEFLDKLNAVREILTSHGRTPVQGALAWIWAKSGKTIPIPGFKTVTQVEENCAALQFGPLIPAQMAEIDQLLGRGDSQSAGSHYQGVWS